MNGNRKDLENWDIKGFQFRELIHEGTFIYIYRAFQHSLSRYVAVYTLSPSTRHDRDCQRAIERAAEIQSKYEHPNIVPVVDCGHHQGVPYIVTQWMSGGLLRDYLWQKQQGGQEHLSPQEMAGIIKQIASALHQLHVQGEIQGDPCTSNIAMDRWGNAYISDFMKRAFDETYPTGNGQLHGMPSYMAPERWRHRPSNALTDQYALGVIAYEVVTGRTPFEDAQSSEELRNLHFSRPIPSPQLFRSTLSDSVSAVLEKALAKNPTQRYSTTLSFALAFENAIMDTPTEIFISYSRKDSSYKNKLKADLVANGFQVWTDEQIAHGEQWFNEINEAIRHCAAVIVLMTTSAELSEWVQKEVLLAKRYRKAIFPILLDGSEFPILIDTQFEDARDTHSMPSPDFYRRLSQKVYGTCDEMAARGTS
ncbi:MAP/microtubule affinity-regulating kinase 3 [Seminavis robusta]|uniref:MAP/microtubule affinity-regulating kinase 3 n=1 Tax=Seminavis robusta TaxID=568900 RepID=A0A9N8H9A4_9STRA|nr:MAP/microtubule affinity-regulating kinase 3 [Seminavis robusta]|eukprot:Sro269_g103890.1 MAP/microtubule affinity-regulating kinase 3 (422) ;mRNA; f:8123-9388